MKNFTDFMNAHAKLNHLLIQNVETEKDVEKTGLTLQEYYEVKAIYEDLSKPDTERKWFFDHTDKASLEMKEHIRNFFVENGYNVADYKEELNRDKNGDGIYTTVGLTISTNTKHWNMFYLQRPNLCDYTLKEAYLTVSRYPEDFDKEDFKELEDYLDFAGEQKAKQYIELVCQAKEYEGDFLNVAGMQKDILDGYYKGDEITGGSFTYGYVVESPMNSPIDFDRDKVIVTYTDNEQGLHSGNAITIREFMNMTQKDFECFVNESIAHDPYMNSDYEKEDR